MNMEKRELLKQIFALDFSIIDIDLYLNTHPVDSEAIAIRNAYVQQCNQLKLQYESCYGMLCAQNTVSPPSWQWICEPWPWKYKANFKL